MIRIAIGSCLLALAQDRKRLQERRSQAGMMSRITQRLQVGETTVRKPSVFPTRRAVYWEPGPYFICCSETSLEDSTCDTPRCLRNCEYIIAMRNTCMVAATTEVKAYRNNP